MTTVCKQKQKFQIQPKKQTNTNALPLCLKRWLICLDLKGTKGALLDVNPFNPASAKWHLQTSQVLKFPE